MITKERGEIKERTLYPLSHLSGFLHRSGQDVSYDEPFLNTGPLLHLHQDDVGEQHEKGQVGHLRWKIQRATWRDEKTYTASKVWNESS